MQLAAATTLAPAAFSLAIIALGINGGAHDEKWIRVSAVAAGAAGSGEDCWIDRGSLHSERTCCPSPTGETPCNPLGEWLEAVLASVVGAYLIPLLPWLLHVNVRLRHFLRHDMWRLGLHVGILTFRLLVLWLIFDAIEDAIVGSEEVYVAAADAGGGRRRRAAEMSGGQISQEPSAPEPDLCTPESCSCSEWKEAGECEANPVFMTENCATSCSACWYGHMRSGGTCAELYDFSDHEVLFMVSYLATAGVEAYAYFASGRAASGPAWIVWLVFVPLTTIYAIALTICMYRTAAFFHTPAESLGAWLIAFLCVSLPLFLGLRGGPRSWLHGIVVEPAPKPGTKRAAALGMGAADTGV